MPGGEQDKEGASADSKTPATETAPAAKAGSDDGHSTVAEDIGAKDPTPKKNLPSKEEADRRDQMTLTDLKKFYGKWLLIMMAGQLGIVNIAFFVYAWRGYDFAPPDNIVRVWLVATFVEIVSVVVVVTRSLFPPDKTEES